MMEAEAKSRWRDGQFAVIVQLALAAILFMAMSQLTQTIVTRGLAMLGARTDVPMITAVEACGRRTPTRPIDFASSDSDEFRVALCPEAGSLGSGVQIEATAPSGRSVTLLVNGVATESRTSSGAQLRFFDVRLRPGENILAIASGEQKLASLRTESPSLSYTRTWFGLLPRLAVGTPISLYVPHASDRADLVGSWQEQGRAWFLFAGPAGSRQRVAGLPPFTIEADGLAVVSAPIGSGAGEAVPGPPGPALAQVPPLDASRFHRWASVARQRDGSLQLTAEACLPKSSQLAQWAAGGTLGATEFVARLTGMDFNVISQLRVRGGDAISTFASDSCQMIKARSVLPPSVVRRRAGNFLATPFDKLTISGFGRRLRYSSLPASTPGPRTAVFAGHGADPETTLSIQPDFLRFRTRDGDTSDATAAGPPTSTLALAWGRAEQAFPNWLQALLSGIAAITPIALLILVIRKGRETEPVVSARRPMALNGLYVLLLLAVSAAAQPFLFQIYFRALDAFQLWDMLVEARGDGSSVYPDPYAPVALAITLMLLPFLRALRRGPGRPRSAIVPIACLIFSLAAVLVLLGASIVEILAWHPLRELEGQKWHLPSFSESPEAVLPIMLAALGFACATAWIPVYWSFNLLVPRKGYFLSAFFAGAAATLLPCLSYGIEASRTGIIDGSIRYSDAPALLALLGASILPFTLLLAMLFVFREILVIVARPFIPLRRKRLMRTRNLVLFAILLTIPRWALESVSVAPADMGIIDILGIFQSFGLVVSLIAAVALLRSYSPLAPPGTAKEIRPFLFGRDELGILAALFAGYLALWSGGALATLVSAAVGWHVFRRLVIESETPLPSQLADSKLAQALIEHRQDCALFEARRKQVESCYTGGECEFDAMLKKRHKVDEAKARQEAAMGIGASEAKRRLLEFGPGSSPFSNGMRGALSGLGFAVLLQLAASVYGARAPGPVTSWADLARQALSDPAYAIAPAGAHGAQGISSAIQPASAPELLLFVGALINACFLWVVLGFVFGFAFHRIRGDDGMVKGLVFASGVAMTFALSQLFSADAGGVELTRMIPVFFFLLVLGVAVFDAASLARYRQNGAHLTEVYGIRTSLGYASLIGAIAALQPVLGIVRGFFGKG